MYSCSLVHLDNSIQQYSDNGSSADEAVAQHPSWSWDRCGICQTDNKNEQLQDPQNNRGFKPETIQDLSKRMLLFNEQVMPECAVEGLILKLIPDYEPSPIKSKPDPECPKRAMYAGKLASTFLDNRVKFHKSCKLAFAHSKLAWAERAAKRKREEQKAQAEAEAAKNISPIKKTRSVVDSSTPYQREAPVRMCFYHNAFDDDTCTGTCDPLPQKTVKWPPQS